jgi:hypothetical protein
MNEARSTTFFISLSSVYGHPEEKFRKLLNRISEGAPVVSTKSEIRFVPILTD